MCASYDPTLSPTANATALGEEALREEKILEAYEHAINFGLAASESCFELCDELRPFIDQALRNPFAVDGKKLFEKKEKIDGEITTVPRTENSSLKLPRSANDYDDAEIEIGLAPGLIKGCTTYTEVRFGYAMPSKFDRIGAVSYVVINDNTGKVEKIGFHNEQVREIFFDHLKGKILSDAELARITEVNTAFLHALRNEADCWKTPQLHADEDPAKTPSAQLKTPPEELRNFLDKRGHEAQWDETGQFGFYHQRNFSVRKFQEKHGFTDVELFRAGILTRSISKEGEIRYRPKDGGVKGLIIIPFFDKQGGVVSWRMRKVQPIGDEPKYLGNFLDRSIRNLPPVTAQFYFGQFLKSIKGKDVIVTEGEIKCLVNHEKTEIFTFGILGITNITREMILAFKAAGAKSVTFVLDNDSIAKGLKRADERSDAERATYTIAKEFVRLGVPNVRCGSIADATSEKAGLDDMQLPLTNDDARERVKHILDSALIPDEYAAKKGLDPLVHEFRARRSLLKKTIEFFDMTCHRGGTEAYNLLSSEQRDRLHSVRDKLQTIATAVEAGYDAHLDRLYGVRRLDQASYRKYYSLFANEIERANKKSVITRHRRRIPISNFTSDVIQYLGWPSDLPADQRPKDGPGIKLDFSMRNVTKALYTGKCSPKLKEFILIGAQVLGEKPTRLEDSEKFYERLRKTKTHRSFSLYALAGHLAQRFSPDEYKFSMNVELHLERDSYRHLYATIPVLIQKTNGTVVAMASMPSWEVQSVAGESARGITTPQRGAERESRERAAIRSFFRTPSYAYQIQKFTESITLIGEYSRRRRSKDLTALMARFGMDEHQVKRSGIMLVLPEDGERIIRKMNGKDLLMQMAQTSLLAVKKERGDLVWPYKGPVLLFPIKSTSRPSIRIAPLTIEDHLSSSVSPIIRLAHPLYGSRTAASSRDPALTQYMGYNLKKAANKTLILAFDEVTAAVLSAAFSNRGDVAVVSLGSDLHPRNEFLKKIKESRASRVIFVGGNMAEDRSRYRRFMGTTDPNHPTTKPQIPTHTLDLYDNARRLKNDDHDGARGMQIEYVPLQISVPEWLRSQPDPSSPATIKELQEKILDAADIVTEAAPAIYRYSVSSHQSVMRPFAKGLEDFEKFLYYRDDLKGNERQTLNNIIARLPARYEKLRKLMEDRGRMLPGCLKDYLVEQYQIEVDTSRMDDTDFLNFLVDERGKMIMQQLPKPLYNRHRDPPREFNDDYRNLENTLHHLFADSELSPESTPLPVHPEWLNEALGEGQIRKERKLVRKDQVSKLNEVVQELGTLNYFPSTHFPLVARSRTKQIPASNKYECTWTFTPTVGEKIEVRVRGVTKRGTKHKAAQQSLKVLKGELNSIKYQLRKEAAAQRRSDDLSKEPDQSIIKSRSSEQ